MESLKTYLTKEGWQQDWQKTKEDFPKTTKVLTDLVTDESGAMKASTLLYTIGGLDIVFGTVCLVKQDWEIGAISYFFSGAMIYLAGKKRSQGD